MRTAAIMISLTLYWLISGCAEDTSVEQTNDQNYQEVVSDNGRGTVVGWQGYFSVALGPDGFGSGVPYGYMISNPTWEQGAPDSLHRYVYLYGRQEDLANAHRVRATGNWKTIAVTGRTFMNCWVNLTIDSLVVLE